MARKNKSPEKPANHERWLVSYGDFLTLLFAVFVALYAMGRVDQNKAEQATQSLREAFGLVGRGISPAAEGAGVLPLMNVGPMNVRVEEGNRRKFAAEKELIALQAAVEAWLETSGVSGISAEITRRGLIISLEGTSFFASGSATIRPEAMPLLDRMATFLAPYDNPVRVEGFTDNLPTSSSNFPSNWELSASRASAVVRYFTGQGIAPSHLAATGYGEHYPIAENGTEEGRRRNRRVDIVLLAGAEAQNSL